MFQDEDKAADDLLEDFDADALPKHADDEDDEFAPIPDEDDGLDSMSYFTNEDEL
jgi:hypothetical protein